MKTYSQKLGEFVEEYKALVAKYDCMIDAYDPAMPLVAVSCEQGIENGWISRELVDKAIEVNFKDLDSCVNKVDKGIF